MNRNFKDFSGGGRSFLLSQNLRRGHSLNGLTTPTDENLDLFSRNRRSISVAPSDESDASLKLGKISIGPVRVTKSAMDELLTSIDGGKHDYDWLLTPPETPLFTASEGNEFQSSTARTSYAARSTSNRASRLSTHSESSHSARPARSSSVTRSSVPSALNSTAYSNRSSSVLNTSSGSVSSYIRPSSPATRSSSSARQSTPSRSTATASRPSTPTRTTSSRPSTPSRGVRAPSAAPSIDRSRPSVSSRPSTPSSRPHASSTPNSRPSTPSSRPHAPSTPSNSRPSTPTRRNPVAALSPSSNYTTSGGRGLSSGRSQSSVSRPSSPARSQSSVSRPSSPAGPRARSQQPVVPSNFPLDTPPNLRTSFPADRPVSIGRSRPSSTAKVNMETQSSVNMPRRPSSPIVSRGRSVEPPASRRVYSSGHHSDVAEPRRSTYSDSSTRKPLVKSSISPESNGFGRNISKKSLDMAIRHMDIRNGAGSMHNLPSTALYPQSVRSSTRRSKSQTAYVSSNSSSIDSNESLLRSSSNITTNGFMSENGRSSTGVVNYGHQREDWKREDTAGRIFARVSEVDIFESSRYDTMLLKEDIKNTNWLHSIDDDKSDQGFLFDNGLEALPEPFSLK